MIRCYPLLVVARAASPARWMLGKRSRATSYVCAIIVAQNKREQRSVSSQISPARTRPQSAQNRRPPCNPPKSRQVYSNAPKSRDAHAAGSSASHGTAPHGAARTVAGAPAGCGGAPRRKCVRAWRVGALHCNLAPRARALLLALGVQRESRRLETASGSAEALHDAIYCMYVIYILIIL